MSTVDLPPGYLRSATHSAELVARDWARDALAAALARHGSLYEWAAAQQPRDALRGRGIAWAVTLDAGVEGSMRTPVVVRHSRHGGLLASVRGDVFVRPTRAPRELAASVRLAAGGVATPELLGYAVYPVAGPLARSDVITRRLPSGRDFPEAWRADDRPVARGALLEAVATLLRALSTLGAHHPDLNLKNVYIAGELAAATAYVLDVDRVRFTSDGQAAARNFARFARSARKWDAQHALGIGDDALVRLAALAWVDQ